MKTSFCLVLTHFSFGFKKVTIKVFILMAPQNYHIVCSAVHTRLPKFDLFLFHYSATQ